MNRPAVLRLMMVTTLLAGVLTACGTTVSSGRLQSAAGNQDNLDQDNVNQDNLDQGGSTGGGADGPAPAAGGTVGSEATGPGGPTTPIAAAPGASSIGVSGSTASTAATVTRAPGVTAKAATGKPRATTTSTGPKAAAKRPAAGTNATAAATANTEPILIGLTYQDNSAADAALGVANSAPTASPKTVSEAMVAGINATGGINGRKLKTIEYSFNTDTASFSADATAACDAFTQDNHVSIVIDAAFGTIGGFQQCLQQAGVLDISTSDAGDTVADQTGTLHANTLYMTLDRGYAAVLNGLTATGYLSKANQLGIIVEGCTEDTNAYKNTVVPLIASLGLKKPVMTQLACTTGFGTAETDSAALANDVLTFRGDGVDRVMIISAYEEVVWGLFAVAASSQNYTPGYALSTLAEAHYTKASIPQSQWPQINGVGYVPGLDVDDTGIKPTPAESQCISLITAGQLTVSDYDDDVLSYWYCAPFLLLETALKADGYNYDPARLQASINALGTTVQGPGLLADSTRYTGAHHDAPNLVQVFTEVASCSCVHYTGSPMAAPA